MVGFRVAVARALPGMRSVSAALEACKSRVDELVDQVRKAEEQLTRKHEPDGDDRGGQS